MAATYIVLAKPYFANQPVRFITHVHCWDIIYDTCVPICGEALKLVEIESRSGCIIKVYEVAFDIVLNQHPLLPGLIAVYTAFEDSVTISRLPLQKPACSGAYTRDVAEHFMVIHY